MTQETLPGELLEVVNKRLDDGDARMGRLEQSVAENTALTAQVARDTADLVEFARAAAWIGKMAKPFSYIATIGGAIAATWAAFKSGTPLK